MNNYPADIRRYDYDPRSPFYDDIEDGLDEKMTDDALHMEAELCESAMLNPDLRSAVRDRCERRGKAIAEEQRQRALQLDE